MDWLWTIRAQAERERPIMRAAVLSVLGLEDEPSNGRRTVVEGVVQYEGIPMESSDCSVGGTDMGAVLLEFEGKRVRVTVEVIQ